MGNKTKRLVLLDAHAIIHRAYHALPDFSSSKGEPTGALFGLSAMLVTSIQKLKPDYIVACFDLPGPTHRHDVYDGYKGTRTETDDALIAQLNTAREVFKAFGIQMYDAPGYEADDVLGTIVSQCKNKGIEIVIVSGDHDTLQLVDGDRVKVFTQRRGINDTIMYDEEGVYTRYGFAPQLIPDYKGLRGDPSDNIPGVKGIGEKGATELITTFGSLEEIYKTLHKNPEAFERAGIKPRTVKLLQEGEDDAVFSKMLATIKTDAPVDFVIPKTTWRESVNAEDILALFTKFEFRTLTERVKKLLNHHEEETKETDEEKKPSEADEKMFREAAVMTWLLSSDLTNPDREDVLRFAGAENIKDAHDTLTNKISETGKLARIYSEIEKPLMSVAEHMHEVGIKLDTARLEALAKQYRKDLQKIEARIYQYVGHEFNINSPKQLGNVLFDELKLTPARAKKTATGARSTRESELEKIRKEHPIIEDILSYRELAKLLSTYIEPLPTLVGKDGRLHARFLQSGTTTGRMASIDPNLQNIPIKTEQGKKIRSAFVAEKGFSLVAIDYSQIELRIAAVLSGDETLIESFQRGDDIHATVAAKVFGVEKNNVDREMRRRAKVINFGILYGMGVNALRAALGEGTGRDEAQQFLNNYFAEFPKLAAYIEETKQTARAQGFTETLFGRRRYFKGIDSHISFVRASAERMAINAPIQGTQADIIKLAMVRADTYLREGGKRHLCRLVLQVHDELVYEIDDSEIDTIVPVLVRIMEDVVDPELLKNVPLTVDVSRGRDWGSLESYEKGSKK